MRNQPDEKTLNEWLNSPENAVRLLLKQDSFAGDVARAGYAAGTRESVATERAAVVAYIERVIENNDAMSWDDSLVILKRDLRAGKHLTTNEPTLPGQKVKLT